MPKTKRDKSKQLRVVWSKPDKSHKIHYPDRPDGRLMDFLFSSEIITSWDGKGNVKTSFLKELEKRGYDITTLRISVWRKDSVIP